MLFALISVNCGAVEIRPATDEKLVVPDQIAAGAVLEVSGTGFETRCGGLGCASCPAPRPLKDVAITLRQGDQSWVLATVDANAANKIEAKVNVPAGLVPGEAVVTADLATAPTEVVAPDE
ncbi:MAG: hypothetical protein ICV72_11470 [Aldersonia sp.]|nr:hypothetical protein [Aldersonia sp.]